MIYAIAMSGGVDSSVCSALVGGDGNRPADHVVGFTMVQYNDVPPFRENVHAKNCADARAVCEKVGIPHFVIDLKNEFADIVLKNFIDEYTHGRTPNPCTVCNRHIKWGLFVDRIREKCGELYPNDIASGVTLVTGHYARINTNKDGCKAIFRATDTRKDQTYMLWKLKPEQINSTLFPLSSQTKDVTRVMAADFGLPVAQKKDSQDICFLTGKYTDFLHSLAVDFPTGDVIFVGTPFMASEKVIGKHHGLPFYTLGQRKGLPSWHKPLFVMRLDAVNNTVVVTDDPEKLSAREFMITDVNWHSLSAPVSLNDIKVQIRYNSQPKEIVSLQSCDNGDMLVVLKEPARSITPGQSAVFYRGDELLGGGVIRN